MQPTCNLGLQCYENLGFDRLCKSRIKKFLLFSTRSKEPLIDLNCVNIFTSIVNRLHNRPAIGTLKSRPWLN